MNWRTYLQSSEPRDAGGFRRTERNGAKPAAISASQTRRVAIAFPFPSSNALVVSFTFAQIAVAIFRACANCDVQWPVFHVVARITEGHSTSGFACDSRAQSKRRLNFVPFALCRFLSAQLRLDEQVDVAIHDRLNIARFSAGAVILDHLVRLKNV